MAVVSEDVERQVWEALDDIIDPELGIPITDLGLVYEVAVSDGTVSVVMTTTTPVCPLGDFLTRMAASRLSQLPDVDSVDVRLTNDPPWSVDRLNERALRALGRV